MAAALDPARSALLIVDLQNDFLHPDGAYARGGLANAGIAALPGHVRPVADAMRAAGGLVVSTQFTLVPGRAGEPLISPHLKALRPFLGKGDFAPGSWGNALVEDLGPADIVIEKVAYSAFYMSRLEWVPRKIGVETLFICGIVTNGGVASTTRDAHLRDFEAIVLSDGCAAFTRERHESAIADLGSLVKVSTCADAARTLSAFA